MCGCLRECLLFWECLVWGVFGLSRTRLLIPCFVFFPGCEFVVVFNHANPSRRNSHQRTQHRLVKRRNLEPDNYRRASRCRCGQSRAIDANSKLMPTGESMPIEIDANGKVDANKQLMPTED
eukprot:Selendium_serpulae@DN6413_c3_g1_i4.p1